MLFPLPHADRMLWELRVLLSVCDLAHCLQPLQSSPGLQLFPPCHPASVSLSMFPQQPVWAHLLWFKQKPHFSPFKLNRQNKSKKYKWFSSGFRNLSPLDKLLAWFNTVQTESVQKLFLVNQNGQSAFKCFASTNCISQEKNSFPVKKRKEKKVDRRMGGDEPFFWRAIWQFVPRAFDLVILPLGIYHKAIIRSRSKD